MKTSDYAPFTLPQLERLRDTYLSRNDTANAAVVREAIKTRGWVQTEELSRSGKLYAIERPRDAAGRVVVEHFGDAMAWMAPMMSGPVIGRIDTELAKQATRREEAARREVGGGDG